MPASATLAIRRAAEQQAAAVTQYRAIGVGVRDYDHDRAALAWALHGLRPAIDGVHLVHAYVPLTLEGCTWDRVTRARDARYQRARRTIAQVLQRVRATRREVLVGGSAIAGLPEDVLIELSSVVDVLVIGDDSAAESDRRKISWRVQDAARCPVVCVPPEYRAGFDGRPVTIVAGEHGLSDEAVDFAAAEADRTGVALQASRTWSSLHEDDVLLPGWLAEQQEVLDEQLADLQLRYPHLPVTGRIEFGAHWLDVLRAGSSLLVAGSHSSPLVRAARTRQSHSCPVAIVPE